VRLNATAGADCATVFPLACFHHDIAKLDGNDMPEVRVGLAQSRKADLTVL
jgi:hypothetical protein